MLVYPRVYSPADLPSRRRPGEEAEIIEDVRQLLARGCDWLSDIPGFGLGELFGVFLQHVCEPVEHLGPLGWRRVEPALERASRGPDGPVHVLLCAFWYLGDDLTGRRVQDPPLLPSRFFDELPTDEDLLPAHVSLLLATRPSCTLLGLALAARGR
jgi:hypothetical protein